MSNSSGHQGSLYVPQMKKRDMGLYDWEVYECRVTLGSMWKSRLCGLDAVVFRSLYPCATNIPKTCCTKGLCRAK